MEVKKPKAGFLVVSELTEDTSPGHGKGHRHYVRAHFQDDAKDIPSDKGGLFANTIEDARNRIAADKRIMSKGTDASGLINWGTMAAREYAIFPVTFGEAVE